jgi:hypothetical protein
LVVAGVVTLARAESVCSGAGVCAPASTHLHSEPQVAPPKETVRRYTTSYSLITSSPTTATHTLSSQRVW